MPESPTRSLPPPEEPAAGVSAASAERHAFHSTVDPSEALSDAGPPVAPAGYELHEEIGRGGMGVVYRAREVALNRAVAIKMLRDRYPAGAAAARRFVEEAQITGQLQHPGIPPVHQVGVLPDGRPFLAMKLIKGSTLEDLLRQRKDLADDRGRFLAAFEQVCQAVACAHDRKVIHRDLKPANVMVGAFAEVQVMDWGLAKVLSGAGQESQATEVLDDGRTEIRSIRDADSATQTGSVLGTPAFMSPEQAGGEADRVDERADVFGLGAILCVILTGKPPYTGKDSDSVRLMAIRGRLEECLARLDACGAEPELVALARRCLSADPAGRPRNAGEVAAAVAGLRAAAGERARQAELERVRAEGECRAAEVRAAEQHKRRKVQAALGLAFTALVVFAGAFAWWQDRQATARRVEAEGRDRDERERLARNAAAAESLLARCEDALRGEDAATAGLLLKEAERQAAEAGTDRLADRLARCRVDFEHLSELDHIDDLRWTVVEGQYQGDKAVAAWSEAFRRYGIVPGSTPSAAAARRILESLVRDRALTTLDLWAARAPSADLAAILRAADPDPFRTDVREAVRAHDTERTRALAARPEALDQPARFAIVLGSLNAVEVDRQKAILYAVLHRRPADFGVLMTLGVLYPIGSPSSAHAREIWFRAALAVRPQNVAALNGLGLALVDNGDPDGAAAAYRAAIRIDPKYAPAHNNLGGVLSQQGDRDGALALFREAARFETKSPIPHLNLGNALRQAGDLKGAVASYRRAADIDPKHRAARRALTALYLLTGDVEKGEALIRHSVDEFRAELGADTVSFSHPLAEFGEDLVQHGLMAAAEPLLRECLAIREKRTPTIWWTYYTASFLGLALAGQGKDEEAGPLLVRGYAGLGLKKSAIPAAFHSRLPDLMRSVALELARLREAAGKPEEAKKWRAEAAKHRSVAPLPREKRS